MKVVLLKNVDKLGSMGETINVADGYARNLLIPAGLAVCKGDSRANEAKKQRLARKSKPKPEKKEKISRKEKRIKRQEEKQKKSSNK